MFLKSAAFDDLSYVTFDLGSVDSRMIDVTPRETLDADEETKR